MEFKKSEAGIAHILVLVAAIGLIGFILVSNTADFKSGLFATLFPKTSSFAQTASSQGDINGSGKVDIFDFNILLGDFGKTDPTSLRSDLNGSGKVDLFDFNILLSNFGKTVATPSPSPSSGPITMHEGVPVCTDHDPIKWHSLVKKNSDNSINCTYTHEHHDDPNSVNDIFGPPGEWFGQTGQAISYPWQTFSFVTPAGVNFPMPPDPNDPTKMENALKHNGYKWLVKRDLPCIPFYYEGCFKAYRVLFHTLGTTADSTARFHSFSVESQVNYKGTIGIIRGGGWMDTGKLGVLVNGGNSLICPPLVTNPPVFTCPPLGRTDGTARNVYSNNVPAPYTPHANPGGPTNWYTNHSGGVGAHPQIEDFGPTDYFDPGKQQFYPEQYRANNSKGKIENMIASVDAFYNAPELKKYVGANNVVNFNGYQDRHGNFVLSGCTQPGVDCVPFIAENAVGTTAMNSGVYNPVFFHAEHDVSSPVTGKSLIKFPN